MNTQPRVFSPAATLGTKIVSPDGEEIGTLKELMIDLDEGYVNYAVVSFDSFLAPGNKLFAIPWAVFTFNAEDRTFILNADKEQLIGAPGFDEDNWPNEAQHESGWLVDLYKYYGHTPYWMSEMERMQKQQR